MPLQGIDSLQFPTQHFVLGYVELDRWPKGVEMPLQGIDSLQFPTQHFVLGYVEMGRWPKIATVTNQQTGLYDAQSDTLCGAMLKWAVGPRLLK